MPSRPRVLSTTPLLLVTDLERSLQFYRHALGFGAPSVWGEPPCFAMLFRDGFELMLQLAEAPVRPTPNGPGGHWDVYLRVDDLGAELAALAAAGVAPAAGPRDTFYGMRELEVVDPDGHRWCVAADARARQAFAGVLDLGSKQLRLRLRLCAGDAGSWTAQLDSPDQHALGLGIDAITRTPARLQFTMTALGASYDGAFEDGGDAIRGTWSQHGRQWPLRLRREPGA